MTDPYYAYKKRRDLAIAQGTWQAWTDATGTRRRLQALAACGWSLRTQAAYLGMTRQGLTNISSGRNKYVKTTTAAAVRALYDRLWDVPPSTRTHSQSLSVSVTLAVARRHGWLPPAAWDDDLIDLPTDELDAECARRVATWDHDSLTRARYSYRHEDDRTPLTVAANREYRKRLEARAA